ncbi:zinc finger CCCH domain-containing protein 32-like isoform X2 [Telopea speciosissima]|uniref:zinc finger CCCH domain-containing protein 32-like isoform X2 n=1 Tax=Telopea speciosissima TaxID=54955 RepID=UPI001CC47666|nr:zinc finger CCCH domain-containing protein 32-like isoform X2 [Telopea speciosissima]
MEFYGRNPSMEGNQPDPAVYWSSPGAETGLEESMWQLGSGSNRELYPERPGEPECVYYMRTGSCGYGSRCRFNHPRDRSTVVRSVRPGGGEYPERVGHPACQYYLKTGTCKFGASCKYHHPRYGGGSVSPVSLNYYGFPMRPGERECSYYMKTGQCKFGRTCKFHHPQPAGVSVPASAPPFYPMVQSPSAHSPHQFRGVTTSWQVARPPLLTGSFVQGAYGPVLLPSGMVPVPGFNPYLGPVTAVASPTTQSTVGAGPVYGVTQLSPSAPAYPGPYQTLPSPAGPSSNGQKELIYPERHGQPECQYYMKTGECKFGSSCRYHHPRKWITPRTNCVLSTIGLPLRPGAPPCTFYAQNGVCKFGPTCKFDHPMGILSYSPSASSLADMPVTPYPVGSSLATLAPSSSSSELRIEFVSGSSKDSFSTRIPSSENMASGSVGSIFSKSGTVPHSRVQKSGQSFSPPSGSGTGQTGETHSSS